MAYGRRGSSEIVEVEGDDRICLPDDRCSEDVAVFRVRQHKAFREVLVARHQSIQGMRIHGVASADGVRLSLVRILFEKGPHPLLVNVVCPSPPK